MLTVYADESGMDGQSSIVTIAGYVSDPDSWDAFQLEWKQYEIDNGIQVFHATDLAANKREFSLKNGWTQKRCDAALRIADNIISKYALQGFVSYTTIEACERLFPLKHPNQGRRKFSWEYCIAGMGFISLINKWATNEGYSEPIQFVFECGAHGRGLLERTLEWNMNDDSSLVGGYSFVKKGSMVQLYVADRLANLMSKWLSRYRLTGQACDPDIARKLKLSDIYISVIDEENWPEFDAKVRLSIENYYESFVRDET